MEKYQAGEDYGDVEKDTTSFFSDPGKIAQDLLREYGAVRSQTSLRELQGVIETLLKKGEPLDDKKGYAGLYSDFPMEADH
jgi:hypothetical protein